MTTTQIPADTSGYTWAVFSDEGMLQGAMSYASAITAAATEYADDDVVVARECSEHEEQRADFCEECSTDEDNEDEDEDEDEESEG